MTGKQLALAFVVVGALLAPIRTLADGDNPSEGGESGKCQLIVKVAEGSEGRGTVSGSGYYLPGEIVTLKATPKKGYFFSTWAWENPEDPFGTGEYWVADFILNFHIDSQKQSVKMRMPEKTTTVVAEFIKASDDRLDFWMASDWYLEGNGSSIIFEYLSETRVTSVKASGLPSGMSVSFVQQSTSYYEVRFSNANRLVVGRAYTISITMKNASGKTKTRKVRIHAPNKKTAVQKGVLELDTSSQGYRFTAGVKYNWADLGISVKSGWKITKVTGLPPGMKWNAAKQRITGVPAKKGNYTVMFTVAKGKTSYQASATFRVFALPSGVAGTFNGIATRNYELPNLSGEYMDHLYRYMGNAQLDSYSANAKITVNSAGKITAKIGGVTFSGTGLTLLSDGKYKASLKKTTKITSGSFNGCSLIKTCVFEIDPSASWDSMQLIGEYQPTEYDCGLNQGPAWGVSKPFYVVAQRNPYGKNSKKKYVNAAAGKIASRLAKYGSMKTKCGMEGTGVYGLVGPICGEYLKSSALFFKVNSAGVVSVSGKIGSLAVSGSSVLRVAPTTWSESAWPPYEIGDYDEGIGDYRREWTGRTCQQADFCLTVSKKQVRIHIEFNPENGVCRHGWATVGYYRWDEYRENNQE